MKKFFIILFLCLLSVFLLYVKHNHTDQVTLTREGFVPQIIAVGLNEPIFVKNERNMPFQMLLSDKNNRIATSVGEIIPVGSTVQFPLHGKGVYLLKNSNSPRYFPESVLFGIGSGRNASQLGQSICINGRISSDFCIENYLTTQMKAYGLRNAMGELKKLYDKEPAVRERCNDYTRRIGEVAYKLHVSTRDFFRSDQASFCNYGFLIGYLDALFALGGNEKDARQFCTDIRNSKGLARHSYMECLKGYGQGFVPHYDFESGEHLSQQLKRSTDACDTVTEDENERNICVVGVMSGLAVDYDALRQGPEQTSPASQGKPSDSVLQEKIKNGENPLEFCKFAPERYQPQCYGSMAGMLIYSGRQTFQTALALAQALTNKEGQIRATRIIAKISYNKDGNDYAMFVRLCRELPEYLKHQCFISLVQGAIELGTPGKEYADGLKFCHLDALTESERTLCIKFVLFDTETVLYGKKKEEEVCRLLEEKYLPYCNNYKEDFFAL